MKGFLGQLEEKVTERVWLDELLVSSGEKCGEIMSAIWQVAELALPR